jgi:hypothetical protein
VILLRVVPCHTDRHRGIWWYPECASDHRPVIADFILPPAQPTNPGCSPADLSEPYGVLNFFDVAAYLALYNNADPAADLAPPFGVINFFDLSEYLTLYNAGCP